MAFCLLLGTPGFSCWFSFAPGPVFPWCCSAPRGSLCVGHGTLFLSSPHLCFVVVFVCDLFVSRGGPLVGWRAFTRTEQLCVLKSHGRGRGRGWGPVGPVWAPSVFSYWPFQGSASVVVPYCCLFLLSVFILWFSYYVSDIFWQVLGGWMTAWLGGSCSFGLPQVPFVDCCRFVCLVISLLVLRAGCGIWLYQFLIIAYLFTLPKSNAPERCKQCRPWRAVWPGSALFAQTYMSENLETLR